METKMNNTKIKLTLDQNGSITEQAEFTVDELGFMQTALNKVLAAAARGEIDLNLVAKQTLAGRGLDLDGEWVGFKKAKEIHNV